MNLNKKIIVGSMALAGVLSLPLIFKESTRTYWTPRCETYQGHHENKSDGINIYVFDEKILSLRKKGDENYMLFGDPEWKDQLKRFRSYRLLVKERITMSKNPELEPNRGPLRGTLISFQPCTESEQNTERR